MSAETRVESDDNVDSGDQAHSLPSVLAHCLVMFTSSGIVNDPVESDETIMDPVDLEQDSQEEGGRCVDEQRIERSMERRWELEEGNMDRQAENEFWH